jgi:hypothetical protein
MECRPVILGGGNMMIRVEMLAFKIKENFKFRPVDISSCEKKDLDAVFEMGQNDFQPSPDYYSVSMGDVIHWVDGKKYLILGMGFKELDAQEYLEYKATPRRDRQLLCL